MTDTEMIDWLESYVNEHGAILLHDGGAKPTGHAGLGLRPGSLRRTLRGAIRQAALPSEPTTATDIAPPTEPPKEGNDGK